MLGVLVNCGGILLGVTVGCLFKKLLQTALTDAMMKAVAFCVLLIGISGALKGQNMLITIFSMVLGTLIGTLLHIDDAMNRLGNFVQKKFTGGEKKSTVAEAFISSSLLFCVGAMAVVGSLSAGLSGDNSTLFSKAVLDACSGLVLAATLGYGVALSVIPVFLYQGGIVLLASLAEPYLGESVIAEMTCVGSLLIVALSLNMIGLTKIKIADMLPAIFLPILFCLFL